MEPVWYGFCRRSLAQFSFSVLRLVLSGAQAVLTSGDRSVSVGKKVSGHLGAFVRHAVAAPARASRLRRVPREPPRLLHALCLYRSIARCFPPPGRVDSSFLCSVASPFDGCHGMDGLPYEHYLLELRKPTGWGGQVELQALSLKYRVNFVIYNAAQQQKSPAQPTRIDNGFPRTLMLCYMHGNHYDCVYRREEFDVLAFCQALVYGIVDRALGISRPAASSSSSSSTAKTSPYPFRYDAPMSGAFVCSLGLTEWVRCG
jgi:hypothetical protein